MPLEEQVAAGARLIAVPGWPLPAFCTASMASTRTVSTARESSSVQPSGYAGGLASAGGSGSGSGDCSTGSALSAPVG